MQFARSKYKVPFLSCYAVNNGIMMVVVVVVFYQGGKDLNEEKRTEAEAKAGRLS
jgi:hypothetical protein